jgi:TRAP-type C4-dicarboxylate transport system permease small subunit
MHISINYLRSKLQGPAQSALTVIIYFVTSAFFIYCIKEGLIFSLAQWTQRSTAMQIPMTIPYLAIPLGFGIMLLVTIECFIAELRQFFKRNLTT